MKRFTHRVMTLSQDADGNPILDLDTQHRGGFRSVMKEVVDGEYVLADDAQEEIDTLTADLALADVAYLNLKTQYHLGLDSNLEALKNGYENCKEDTQAEIDGLVQASDKLINACTTEEQLYRETILKNIIAKHRSK